MSMKHTPGPWIHTGAIVHAANYPADRVANCDRFNRDSNVSEANAKLIAAAPDMAEALHGALETLCEIERASLPGETRTIVERRITSTRAALAKAGL